MSKVSVLIPAYNEELSLPELYSKLKEMMEPPAHIRPSIADADS